ncbi:MAG TPA: DNA-processing protein DprA [Candidatus Paceibacterota bacterium]
MPIHIIERGIFPPLFAEIPDAPERLFVRGTLPSPDEYIYLCVVGSRHASPYGKRAAASLIASLSGYKIVIVSGLALGIDADAHTAALAAGLPTIAVLPSSVDDASIYPATNRALAARILERGGALISEYTEGSRPAKWTFPARNRIMAGLSHATLLIEASEKSGTLITARLALDYNRDVLCVPHPIGSENGAGNNRLLREGATLIRSSDDILEALGLRSSTDPRESPRTLPLDLGENEYALLSALTEPLTRDELIERSGLAAQHANIALSSLSIRGLVIERLGKVERV